MSIPFQALKRINPQNIHATPKFYAQLLSSGTIDLDRIAKIMSDGSTVRKNDIYAVLIGMVDVINDELAQGKIIKIDKLGTFRLSARSIGSATAKEVSKQNIKKAIVLYKPGQAIKRNLKTLDYKKLK